MDEDSLKNILHKKGLSNGDKLLFCLSTDSSPKSVSQIIHIAVRAGLTKAGKWNISSYLASAKGKAIRTPKGWELTEEGNKYVQQLASKYLGGSRTAIVSSLRILLSKIKDKQTSSFVEEAIKCYEAEFYRGAVVLSWVGAISLLYDYVVTRELTNFNAEAKHRDPKWKDAKTKDDLTNMGEYDFLQVLKAISVFGKSVKDELEGCLKFRNGCGHPNALKIGPARVSAHIETLINNVYTVFV